MSEYIGYFFIGMISCVLYLTLLVTVLVWRERVIRCRDCKYYDEIDGTPWCDFFDDNAINPDGFCAWGERREP